MEKTKFIGRAALAAGAATLLAALLCLCACSSSTNSDSGSSDQQAEEQAEPVYVLTKAGQMMEGVSLGYTATVDDVGAATSVVFDVPESEYSEATHTETTYEYDEQGAPVASVADGVRSMIESTLDEQGRLASLVSTSEDGSSYYEHELTYSDDGKIASKTSYVGTSADEIESMTTYEFNEYGWTTKRINESYDNGETITGESTYTFEGDDPAHPTRITQTMTDDMTGEEIVYAFLPTYDENGNLMKLEYEGNSNCYYEFEWQKVDSPSAIVAALAPQNIVGGCSVILF